MRLPVGALSGIIEVSPFYLIGVDGRLCLKLGGSEHSFSLANLVRGDNHQAAGSGPHYYGELRCCAAWCGSCRRRDVKLAPILCSASPAG